MRRFDIIVSGGSVSAGPPRRRGGLRPGYKLLLIMAVLAGLALGAFRYSQVRIRPIIAGMAEAHARSIGARAVGEAINAEIMRGSIAYGDLISLDKAADGRISALTTDILAVNRLKAALAVEILNRLENMEDINLYIPAGNLLSGEFLSGRGPRVQVILIPVGAVTTDIRNVFTSAGINQTRHQIMLDVRVSVAIILPFSVEQTDIFTSVPIAETIIVGDVPNIYMSGDSPGVAVPP